MPELKERLDKFKEYVQDWLTPGKDQEKEISEEEAATLREEKAKLQSFRNALAVARESTLPVFKERIDSVRIQVRKALDSHPERPSLVAYWSGYQECLLDLIRESEDA